MFQFGDGQPDHETVPRGDKYIKFTKQCVHLEFMHFRNLCFHEQLDGLNKLYSFLEEASNTV